MDFQLYCIKLSLELYLKQQDQFKGAGVLVNQPVSEISYKSLTLESCFLSADEYKYNSPGGDCCRDGS